MPTLKSKFRKNLLALLITDILLASLAYAGAYFLRFDLKVTYPLFISFRNTLIPVLSLKILAFYFFGLYQGMWRYTSIKDLENIIKASLTAKKPRLTCFWEREKIDCSALSKAILASCPSSKALSLIWPAILINSLLV